MFSLGHEERMRVELEFKTITGYLQASQGCMLRPHRNRVARTNPTNTVLVSLFLSSWKKRNKTENFMNEKRAIYKEPFIHVFLFIFFASLFTFQIYKWFLNIYECCLTLFTRSRFFGASFFSPFRKLKRNRKKKGEAQQRRKKTWMNFCGLNAKNRFAF